MTVTAVRKDPEQLTMIVDSEFDAPPERVWELWSDPRQLERWWGPPTYPATVTSHDLRVGGLVEYYMTGPEGDRPRAFWRVTEVDPPHRLAFLDVLANADGTPNADIPETEQRVIIEAVGDGRTRMSVENIFASPAAMEQLLAMGMESGLVGAIGQIDAILAETRAAAVAVAR
jgi:uncharacterized protein YndB with AHSA1/START domain